MLDGPACADLGTAGKRGHEMRNTKRSTERLTIATLLVAGMVMVIYSMAQVLIR